MSTTSNSKRTTTPSASTSPAPEAKKPTKPSSAGTGNHVQAKGSTIGGAYDTVGVLQH